MRSSLRVSSFLVLLCICSFQTFILLQKSLKNVDSSVSRPKRLTAATHTLLARLITRFKTCSYSDGFARRETRSEKSRGRFLVFQSKAEKRSLKKGYCFRGPLFSVSNKVTSKKNLYFWDATVLVLL